MYSYHLPILFAATYSLRQFAPLFFCYFSAFSDCLFVFGVCTSSLNLLKILVFPGLLSLYCCLSQSRCLVCSPGLNHIAHMPRASKVCLPPLSLSPVLVLGLGQAQGKGLSTPSPSILTTGGEGRAATTVPAFPTRANCGLGLTSYVLAGHTYLDLLQASLSQYCP